jgi:hypothetical protein
MKCEHAQEFFSEYIESSLDKPTGVALEAHLTACERCRSDVEGLRQTWAGLNAVPAVEPPRDLVWRVMAELQQERLERLEAEKRRRNPFVGWLQSLTPGAAFGYATLTALLIIGLAFPLSGSFKQVVFDIFGVSGSVPEPRSSAPITQPAAGANEPVMSFRGTYQDASDGFLYHRLFVTVPSAFGRSQVTVSAMAPVNGQMNGTRLAPKPALPNQTLFIPVPVMVGGQPVESVSIQIEGSQGPIRRQLNVPPASDGGM